jgi:glycosyltransferase involved in cell wall biosynthesis
VRIAFVTDTFVPEFNGIVTATVRHAAGLAARGHELRVLCPRYRDEGVPPEGVELRRYPSFIWPGNPDTRVSLVWPAALERELASFAPDVIHVQTPLALGVGGLRAAHQLGIPCVQTYHSWVPGFMAYIRPGRVLGLVRGPIRPHESWFSARFVRIVYGWCDLVLAPSHTLVAELRHLGVRTPCRAQTNGIDLDEFTPKSTYEPTRTILVTGRLGYEKHAEEVIAAFARFAPAHPGWRLRVLGEGPAAPYLHALVAREGLGELVTFRGFISRTDLLAEYAHADIFATASTIETQGLVVLEAMASGTPVVGVRALAVPEMAHDGVHGIMVEPHDTAAFARALATLADDDALRERLGRAAVDGAAAHAVPTAIDSLEHVYDELAAGRAAALEDGSPNVRR